MANIGVVSKEVIELLRKASTGVIADALAMEGIEGGIMGIRPARGFEEVKIVGPAVTSLFAPSHVRISKLNNFHVIHGAPPGSVLVIDGKGFDGHFTGDNHAESAKKQGLQGIVVYGGARDISGFRKIGMPLYCMGLATRDKPKDFKLTAYNVPIVIGGVSVNPGDVIVADEDGVVAIPAEVLGNVLNNMKTIFELEDGLKQGIRRNATIEELLEIISKKNPKV